MNLEILGGIVLFFGTFCYTYNKYIKSNKFNYDKIFPTNNLDIDMMILSTVNKETLINLSVVNKYLTNIITNNSFWRLRMENRLGLKTKNNATNFKLIINLLDNNQPLSDNMSTLLYHKHSEEIYDVLAENKKYGFFRKQIKNKNLERIVDRIRKNIFNSFYEKEYDFDVWDRFYKETTLMVDQQPNLDFFKYMRELTEIMEVNIVVHFQNNDENILIKWNNPKKIMRLLFELSRQLQIKNINISNTENNQNIINKLLYKVIERLT